MRKILIIPLILIFLGAGCTGANFDSYQATPTSKNQINNAFPVQQQQQQQQQQIQNTASQKSSPSNLSNDNHYTNSKGNTVHSPAYEINENVVPTGASARCKDGTYSFSQNRRGTCSHHGGVAEWL